MAMIAPSDFLFMTPVIVAISISVNEIRTKVYCNLQSLLPALMTTHSIVTLSPILTGRMYVQFKVLLTPRSCQKPGSDIGMRAQLVQ